jgi:hypothetical protein
MRWTALSRRFVRDNVGADMATIRPEVTGITAGIAALGHLAEWIELQRIIPLSEAAQLSGVSVDTLKRRHRNKILELSPRRLGMRVRDALMLPK